MKRDLRYLAPMQRFLGIGLLVVFAFVLVGIYPAQWALRSMAHSEMWRGIREGSVEQARVIKLSFPTTNGRVYDPQFTWKEADEFMFQGAMYDVVGRTLGTNEITFRCIADTDEDGLVHCAALLDPLSDSGNTFAGNGHLTIKSLAKHYVRPITVWPANSGAAAFTCFGTRTATILHGFVRPVPRPPWA